MSKHIHPPFKNYILCRRRQMYLYAKEMLKIPKGYSAGVDPGFQVRGGALKKIAPSGGRREKFWVSRVKNHYFTQKNLIFFQF